MFGRKKKPEKPAINRADRLQSDFTDITSLFKGHRFIAVKETFGVPAEKYVIQYAIDGLHRIGKSIEAKSEHFVEILLPPDYPSREPLCKSLSPVYHPDFFSETIDIQKFWKKNGSLVDLIVYIGEMIAFQRYSTTDPINPEAGKWALRNKSMLPLSSADFNIDKSKTRPLPPQPVVEKTPEKKISQGNVTAKPAVNEIIILEHDLSDVPESEDARKTEGLSFDTDTDQLALEKVSATAASMEKPIIVEKARLETTAIPKPQEPLPRSAEKPRPHEAPTEFIHIPSVNAVAEPKAGANAKPLSRNEESLPVKNQPSEFQDQENGISKPNEDAQPIPQGVLKAPMVLFQFFYCPYCGNKNSKDANFCMTCGSRLKSQKRKGTLKIISIVAMAAIPAITVATGITLVILHALSPKESQTISEPLPVSQPQEPQKTAPLQIPPAPIETRQTKTDDDSVTAADVAQKMMKLPKRQTAPKLSEQKKHDKISQLLQNAKLYMNIGSYDDAIKRFKEVQKLDPTNFEASVGIDNAEEAREKSPPRPPPTQTDE